eukprot:TRINITY_DN40778_c0_g1_i1.p1 TRINITY_DN40778_c0_g1~~TRINITY_DN40778_c0_g1_i1.p1  ORF type:complete len:595 (+),score=120.96 TRINITY_DN40778_c0_g1_i1:53-1786(+)
MAENEPTDALNECSVLQKAADSRTECFDAVFTKFSDLFEQHELKIRQLISSHVHQLGSTTDGTSDCVSKESTSAVPPPVCQKVQAPSSRDLVSLPGALTLAEGSADKQEAAASDESDSDTDAEADSAKQRDNFVKSFTQLKRLSAACAIEGERVSELTPAADPRPKCLSRVQKEELKFSSYRRALRNVTQHWVFELGAVGFILINALFIGLQANWVIENYESSTEPPVAYRVMDILFTVFFTLELLLRIFAEGKEFLFPCTENKNVRWNIFDSSIVISALTEEIFNVFYVSVPNATAMRVLRLLRLVRVLRMVRIMRFFRDLRIMVAGIISSLRSLIWCLILLFMIMFMVALVLVQVISEKLAFDFNEGISDAAEKDKILYYFNSLFTCIVTLYTSIMNGVSWIDAAYLLIRIHPLLGMVFAFYIGFSILCVFNIVTCVFVDKANQFTKSDMDNLIMEEVASREKWIKDMQTIFEEASGTGEGLNRAEFIEYIQNEEVQAYFRRIGLNVEQGNALALFKLIDLDDSGSLTLAEFIDGCSQFVGGARQLDIARLRYDTSVLSNQLRSLTELLVAQQMK